MCVFTTDVSAAEPGTKHDGEEAAGEENGENYVDIMRPEQASPPGGATTSLQQQLVAEITRRSLRNAKSTAPVHGLKAGSTVETGGSRKGENPSTGKVAGSKLNYGAKAAAPPPPPKRAGSMLVSAKAGEAGVGERKKDGSQSAGHEKLITDKNKVQPTVASLNSTLNDTSKSDSMKATEAATAKNGENAGLTSDSVLNDRAESKGKPLAFSTFRPPESPSESTGSTQATSNGVGSVSLNEPQQKAGIIKVPLLRPLRSTSRDTIARKGNSGLSKDRFDGIGTSDSSVSTGNNPCHATGVIRDKALSHGAGTKANNQDLEAKTVSCNEEGGKGKEPISLLNETGGKINSKVCPGLNQKEAGGAGLGEARPLSSDCVFMENSPYESLANASEGGKSAAHINTPGGIAAAYEQRSWKVGEYIPESEVLELNKAMKAREIQLLCAETAKGINAKAKLDRSGQKYSSGYETGDCLQRQTSGDSNGNVTLLKSDNIIKCDVNIQGCNVQRSVQDTSGVENSYPTLRATTRRLLSGESNAGSRGQQGRGAEMDTRADHLTGLDVNQNPQLVQRVRSHESTSSVGSSATHESGYETGSSVGIRSYSSSSSECVNNSTPSSNYSITSESVAMEAPALATVTTEPATLATAGLDDVDGHLPPRRNLYALVAPAIQRTPSPSPCRQPSNHSNHEAESSSDDVTLVGSINESPSKTVSTFTSYVNYIFVQLKKFFFFYYKKIYNLITLHN